MPFHDLPIVGMVVTTADGKHVEKMSTVRGCNSIRRGQHPPKQPTDIGHVSQLTFSKLQLVKDGGFTSSIETDHEDSHLLLAELPK